MLYHLALEDMEPNHYLAWAPQLPGCFSSARTEAEAVANAPARIAAHFEWLAGHGRPWQRADEPVETQVVEVFRSFPSQEDPEYIVNAFFEDDRRSLSADEIEHGLWLLECTRRDLMEAVSRFKPEQLTQPISGEAKDALARILNHLAVAEWWYFDRLDMALVPSWRDLPDDPFARLEQVRAHSRDCLPRLIGDDRIVTRVDERWSARKVLRRALWHERDHTQQIASVATC